MTKLSNKVFTTQFIKDNCGCYKNVENKLEKVYIENNKTYFTEPDCIVTILEVVNSTISLEDKYWFFCNKVFSKSQNQQIAIGVAEIVLPIYESKCPNNKVIRKTIQAAKDYLLGRITLKKNN